ncbi:hypothetical protein BDZ89DRAFT_1130774 [Hymenopellis radicata]|nr:hypothetical protein BDZ89DRAFT_1130774 [Hymenopellis radicata]
MRSLHDKRVVLNQSTIDHSIILPTTAFIDRHLAIGRLTKTDYDDLVVHVLVRLKQSKTIKKGRWDKTRIDFRLEDETFAHLQPIADEIHDLCLQWDKDKGKLGKATARMKYDSSRPMCCEYLDEDRLKTNAYFFLVESSTTGVYGDRAPLVDLTSVGRFRKFVNNRAETEFDIVAAASLILEADECRRFMTAFTVEGNKMSFWHRHSPF